MCVEFAVSGVNVSVCVYNQLTMQRLTERRGLILEILCCMIWTIKDSTSPHINSKYGNTTKITQIHWNYDINQMAKFDEKVKSKKTWISQVKRRAATSVQVHKFRRGDILESCNSLSSIHSIKSCFPSTRVRCFPFQILCVTAAAAAWKSYMRNTSLFQLVVQVANSDGLWLMLLLCLGHSIAIALHLLNQHTEHLGGQCLLQHLQQLGGLATNDDGVGQMLDTTLNIAGRDQGFAKLDLLKEVSVEEKKKCY